MINRLAAILMALTAIASMSSWCFAADGEEVPVVDEDPADSQSIDTLNVGTVYLSVEGEDEAAAEAEAMAAAEIYSIVDNVQYGSYFHATVSNFGEVYIYIPVAYAVDCFSYNSDGIPINITGSSITGYIAGENSNQSIQFPSFGAPRYRISSGYDYVNISSWEEIDSSVIVYDNEDNFNSYSDTYFLRMIFLICAADLVLNFFTRLLGGLRS